MFASGDSPGALRVYLIANGATQLLAHISAGREGTVRDGRESVGVRLDERALASVPSG